MLTSHILITALALLCLPLPSLAGKRRPVDSSAADPRIVKLKELLAEEQYCIEKDDYHLIKTSSEATRLYVEHVCSLHQGKDKQYSSEDYISENYGEKKVIVRDFSFLKEYLYETEDGRQFSVTEVRNFTFLEMFNEINAAQCLKQKIEDPGYLKYLGVVECVWPDYDEPMFISEFHHNTLQQYLDSVFRYSWDRRSLGQQVLTLKMMRMLALEVQQLHKVRVAHRNLQINSIYVNLEEYPILSNFKMATTRGVRDKDRVNEENVLYIDFEMVMGRGNAIWADIYSLGILFGQMVGGEWWSENVGFMMNNSGWKYTKHMSGFYQPKLELLKFPKEFSWLMALLTSQYSKKRPRWDIDKVVAMLDHMFWTYKNEIDQRIELDEQQQLAEQKEVVKAKSKKQIIAAEQDSLESQYKEESNVIQAFSKQQDFKKNEEEVMFLETMKGHQQIHKSMIRNIDSKIGSLDAEIQKIGPLGRKTMLIKTKGREKQVSRAVMDSKFTSDLGEIEHLAGDLDNMSLATMIDPVKVSKEPVIEMVGQANPKRYRSWVQEQRIKGLKKIKFMTTEQIFGHKMKPKERIPLPKLIVSYPRKKEKDSRNIEEKIGQKLPQILEEEDEEEFVYDAGTGEFEDDISEQSGVTESTVSNRMPYNVRERNKPTFDKSVIQGFKKKQPIKAEIQSSSFVSNFKSKDSLSIQNKPLTSLRNSGQMGQMNRQSGQGQNVVLSKVMNQKTKTKVALPELSKYIGERENRGYVGGGLRNVKTKEVFTDL